MGSAVAWSWLFNILRLASGVLLLPLLALVLSKPDFGMYYVFLTMAMVVPMMDFGFALSVERSLAYALGGATSIEAQGMAAAPGNGVPNLPLIGDIVISARRLYRGLSWGALGLLAVGGTVAIGLRVHETSHPTLTWVAWTIHLLALSLEIYSTYWVAVLRGLNCVTAGARWLSIGYGLKLAVSLGLLWAGAGLMAVPIAGLLTGVVLRAGAGRDVHRWLSDRGIVLSRERGASASAGRILRALWPNSWRLGLQLVALFTSSMTYMSLCTHTFGLPAQGEYGLSVQLVNMSLGIAAVWTSVKWPLIAQHRMRGEREAIRAILRPRYLLQVATFLVLAGTAMTLGPWLLRVIHSGKVLLPWPLLVLLVIDGLGQLHFQLWTTLISTENRIPALWPLVITHAVSLVVVVTLVLGFGVGMAALVVTPLISGSLFNYWWWARSGARVLGTTYLKFLLQPTRVSHARS